MGNPNEIVSSFIKKVEPHLLNDDHIIQENILYMIDEFPYIPVSWTNQLLEKALQVPDSRSSILLRLNHFPLNDESVQLMIKLAEQIPNQQRHWLKQMVLNMPIELMVQFEEQLVGLQLTTKQEVSQCQLLLNEDQEQVWAEYQSVLEELDSSKEFKRDRFIYAKKAVKRLVDLGLLENQEVVKNIEEDLGNEWFSFKGIVSVYAAGLLKIDSLIPTIAKLLDREDDLLLEVVSESLKVFQTDEVVEAVYPYAKNNQFFIYGVSILKDTKTESAIHALRKSYNSLNQDGKAMCVEGICSHLSDKALPLIQDFIANQFNTRMIDMEEIYYSYYKIMGFHHPSLDYWKQVAILKEERSKQISDEVFQKYGLTPSSETTKKVGRNDPCPCGSGKKYKKCCGA